MVVIPVVVIPVVVIPVVVIPVVVIFALAPRWLVEDLPAGAVKG